MTGPGPRRPAERAAGGDLGEPPDPDEEVRRLADRAAIHDVLTAYCSAIDRVDVELLRTVYHPGAALEQGDHRGTIEGWIERSWHGRVALKMTTHLIGNVQIRWDGEQAHVETYVLAYHRDDVDSLRVTHARYLDRFERRQGRWAIAARVVRREWELLEDAPRWGAPSPREADEGGA